MKAKDRRKMEYYRRLLAEGGMSDSLRQQLEWTLARLEAMAHVKGVKR